MKKLVIVLILLVAVLGNFIYFLQPKPIVEDISNLEIYRVTENINYEKRNDITTQIDLEQLKELISEYNYKGFKKQLPPHQEKDIFYKIDGIYNNRKIHIIMGNINMVYESEEQGGYNIRCYLGLLNDFIDLIEK